MFSNEDVQDIIRLLPPGKATVSDLGEPGSGLPALLPLSSGKGLILSSHITRHFVRIVESKTSRYPVIDLSQELGVDQETVLQLVRASPTLALLSEDNTAVITKDERDRLEQQLRELVVKQVVSKTSFLRENDLSIESIETLSQAVEKALKDVLIRVDGYLLGQDYHFALMEIMKQRLNQSLKDAEPVEFTSAILLDCPMWYISSRLTWLLKVTYMASQFRVESSTGTIRCIPKNSVVQKRDAEIARLQAGDVPNIDLHAFSKDFGELYPSLAEVQDHVSTLPDIFLIKSTAISKTWLRSFSEQCVRFLEVNGYADFTANIKECFPAECQKELFDIVETQITAAYEEQPEPKLHRVGNFISTDANYIRERDALLHLAKTYATNQWQQLKENPEKDLKFQMSEIASLISSDKPLSSAISKDRSVEKAIDEQYWSGVSDLESKNEAEFAPLWNERVVSKIQIYTEGLTRIHDTKLRDQLADLLSAYIQKELLPDSIAKARSQGLALSRKTRKNIQKLETSLKAGKTDVSGVTTTVDKFGKKQGIPDLEPTALTEIKNGLIGDMVRKMQKKQADGPLLFLTLVIVLLAKQQQGVRVVYATGKFAPKLMKQLKSSLSAERYEELEGWKEKAKAGTLTAEDKEGMKGLAGEL